MVLNGHLAGNSGPVIPDFVRNFWISLLIRWIQWLLMLQVYINILLLLLVGRRPVYTSASLHIFIGRPRFPLPTGVASCTLLTKRSSHIPDMCTLHSVILLCTQDVIFWIPHISRILSFPILSILVLFIILLSVFISVTSNICVVFAVSFRVSAA